MSRRRTIRLEGQNHANLDLCCNILSAKRVGRL